MKKLTSAIAIALLASSVAFNANADDKKIEYKSSNLNIGMYEAGYTNSMKLSMNLTKDKGVAATVKLMDADGNLLHEEVLGKKLTAYKLCFDMSSLKAGKYYVEVKNGERIITKTVVKGDHTLSY
ncbi:T9SS type A sorting domain-containing protein [Emticicia sp. 17c]|uniref:T9SS type A sorting domain-containing protein n=1 Tax=Emticicia sp. 17c TaxID=3127704 RepID=UPI00301CF9D1